jgi:enediyne biosynthesis protein E3
MRDRLEQVGETFVNGYHAALRHGLSASLDRALAEVETEMRGFAFEGAAMGLALLDALSLWRRNRVGGFLRGTGDAHAYMVHVGVGWVWARMPLGLRRSRRGLDPLLSWLAFDGWGFHEGFFHWPEYLAGWPRPKRLSGYERRVFDQGLGRSFWFVNGGNAELMARTISGFEIERQADLWSGIGLAATYAGIVEKAGLAALRAAAGQHWSRLAQGAAFAAKARQRAGNVTDYTELATGVLCEMSVQEAARLCDTTLENLPASSDPPAYEFWRQRIQSHFDHARPHPRRQLLEV